MKKLFTIFNLLQIRINIMSQFFLGEINYKCIKDINYFQLASDQNHVGAQIILGNIFYNGEFIEKDIDISIHFFQLAANQDDTEALL